MIPASIRNNNPGAMYPGKSAKKFGSSSYETLRSRDGVHKIATFPTPIHGAAAQFDLLASSYCGMPIEKAITKWCGGFYASAYLKVLEEKGGLKRTDTLTKDRLSDPAVGIPIARAMAWQEAGRDFPLDDDGWSQAHAMAFAGDAKAPPFAPENDVPSPKRETRIAEAVKTAAPYVAGAGAVGGGGTVAITSKPPLDPKAVIAKGKETREVIEQAKDLGIFARDMGKWAMGDGMFVAGGIGVAAVIAWWWSKK